MELRGRTIVLRDWRETDLPVFHAAHYSETDWLAWDAPFLPGPTDDELPKLIEAKRALAVATPTGPRSELVITSTTSDEMVGRVSRYWQCLESGWLSIGIALFSGQHWGRGMGSEALGRWCDYLFGAMPAVRRLDVRTWSGNDRMMRMAQRLGFQEEARFRQARNVRGQQYDALGFGILREEWAALYPAGFDRAATGSPRPANQHLITPAR